jgi:hypothetical protein
VIHPINLLESKKGNKKAKPRVPPSVIINCNMPERGLLYPLLSEIQVLEIFIGILA